MFLCLALVIDTPRKARRIFIKEQKRHSTSPRSVTIRLLESLGQGTDSRYTYGGTSKVFQSGGGEENQGGRRSGRIGGVERLEGRAFCRGLYVMLAFEP